MPRNLKEQLALIYERHPIVAYKIKTFGLQKNLKLETEVVHFMELKELISGTLKLCYLYQPIVQALQKQISDLNSSYVCLKSLLKVLSDGLFYRYMVQMKAISNISTCSVINFSTDNNRKIIFAAVISFYSRLLTHQEIDSALKIFNLQSAILSQKFMKIPLQANFLTKLLSKIERTINPIQLKNFINKAKQDNYSESMEAYQFIYLAALSNKNSESQNLINFYGQKNQKIINQKMLVPQNLMKVQNTKRIRIKSLHTAKVIGLQFYQQDSITKSNQLYSEIKKKLYSKSRSKSSVLSHHKRSHSLTFSRGISVFNNFMKNSEKILRIIPITKKQNSIICNKVQPQKLKKKKNLHIGFDLKQKIIHH